MLSSAREQGQGIGSAEVEVHEELRNIGQRRKTLYACGTDSLKKNDPEISLEGGHVNIPTDWFWEGNVVDALERALAESGWRIENKADTQSKQQGVDLLASKEGRELFVEAKGYPSKEYRDPRRAGETKPTKPANQAQQWYSHALLKALRLQTKHPNAKIALAFPDFPRYRALFDETRIGLRRLGIAVLFVDSAGKVWECSAQGLKPITESSIQRD